MQALERVLAHERSHFEQKEATLLQTIAQLKSDLEKVLIHFLMLFHHLQFNETC